MSEIDWTLQRHPQLSGRQGPVCVIVLDGVGVGSGDELDAVARANTPTLDRLRAQPSRWRTVRAHGRAVGLPTDADMGNSEVGHNALGAGRVVQQGAALVDQALADGALFASEGWRTLVDRFTSGGTLHLIGLLSDGGVHSRLDQLVGLLDGAAESGARRVRLHVLTDGRDVPDATAPLYLDQLEAKLVALRAQGVDARVASGGGRMFVTMDRYEADWSIVERGWRAHVLADARGFSSAKQALETFRAEDPGVTDQSYPPFVVVEDGAPVGAIEDGDAVCCFHFRGDRVIEISRAFTEAAFAAFERERVPDVNYAGLLQYDGDLKIPPRYLVEPPQIDRTAGEYLVHNDTRTFACSETQKFGHVPYFCNGNRSGRFDDERETYVEIDSDRVSFDQTPAMKAREIAAATVDALRSGKHDLVRINFANGDMVGHTGKLEATIAAVEVVDAALADVLAAVDEVNGRFVVVADHGNADDMAMRDKSGAPRHKDGEIVPRTSHTLAPVPCAVGGAGLPDGVVLRDDLPEAGLANVTATYLELLGFVAPADFEPSLLKT
jgi:2,3-bisphosphoglycerate-independent phosphoglycerate mutase